MTTHLATQALFTTITVTLFVIVALPYHVKAIGFERVIEYDFDEGTDGFSLITSAGNDTYTNITEVTNAAYVYTGSPDTNYDGLDDLIVDKSTYEQWYTYIEVPQFTEPAFVHLGGETRSLQWYPYHLAGNGDKCYIEMVDGMFDEATLTTNNMPGGDYSVYDTSVVVVEGTWAGLPFDNDDAPFGPGATLALKSRIYTSSAIEMFMYSDDYSNAAYRPRVNTTFSKFGATNGTLVIQTAYDEVVGAHIDFVVTSLPAGSRAVVRFNSTTGTIDLDTAGNKVTLQGTPGSFTTSTHEFATGITTHNITLSSVFNGTYGNFIVDYITLEAPTTMNPTNDILFTASWGILGSGLFIVAFLAVYLTVRPPTDEIRDRCNESGKDSIACKMYEERTRKTKR